MTGTTVPGAAPDLPAVLAAAFTPAELELIAPYLNQRAIEARGTMRRDAEQALLRLGEAVRAAAARTEAPGPPPPLPAPRDLAAELVDRGDGWYVSPCKTRVCRRLPVPGLLVCCIPCRSAPDGGHGPHTEACDRWHIERVGIEAVKAGE